MRQHHPGRARRNSAALLGPARPRLASQPQDGELFGPVAARRILPARNGIPPGWRRPFRPRPLWNGLAGLAPLSRRKPSTMDGEPAPPGLLRRAQSEKRPDSLVRPCGGPVAYAAADPALAAKERAPREAKAE